MKAQNKIKTARIKKPRYAQAPRILRTASMALEITMKNFRIVDYLTPFNVVSQGKIGGTPHQPKIVGTTKKLMEQSQN